MNTTIITVIYASIMMLVFILKSLFSNHNSKRSIEYLIIAILFEVIILILT